MERHLVLFDGECALCHVAVQHILQIDRNRSIVFAPLGGETAQNVLSGPQKKLREANSLVLIEDYASTERRFWIRSRAILRIYWLIGGGWAFLGLFSFFPCFFGDFLYRKLALHRHQFKLKMKDGWGPHDRFLP